MTLRYICDRCDLRAEASVGHHVCEEPSDEEINAAVRDAVGYRPYFAFGERQRLQWISPAAPAAPDGTTCDVALIVHDCDIPDWTDDANACFHGLAPIALARGYRFTLTQLGADEYRVSFFHNIDTLASTALDRTPARAFARAWRRLPTESAGTP